MNIFSQNIQDLGVISDWYEQDDDLHNYTTPKQELRYPFLKNIRCRAPQTSVKSPVGIIKLVIVHIPIWRF
jgi:hypothetical protein